MFLPPRQMQMWGFLAIEIIGCFYMHYLLSRRAKGLRSPDFVGGIDKGKAPKSGWGVGSMDSIFEVSYERTWFVLKLAMLGDWIIVHSYGLSPWRIELDQSNYMC